MYGILGLFSGDMLQWGHGREAMDGERGGGRRVAARASFNGAMAVRPWMASKAEFARAGYTMLQWGHGREAMDGYCTWLGLQNCHSFNGAMAVRPWMGCHSRLRAQVRSCFNGAMAVRPWMAHDAQGVIGVCGVLQWGHGREAMDGRAPRGWV